MSDCAARLVEWVRKRRHPFLWAYTLMFVLTAVVCLWPFIARGKHLMWDIDGLQAHYVRFTVFGRWVRQIVRETISAGTLVVPQWDLCLGYGSDLVVYLANYIGNPFCYISIFLPARLAEYGFDVSFLLQFYAAGLSFGFFARERGLSRFQRLIGAIAYVFSGWMLVCIKQFVFIYITVLFPLLLAGAERVFRRQSPMLFVGAVAALFLYYFYFAYMACLLLMAYCVVLYLGYERDRGVRTFLVWVLRFMGYGLLGVLIACATLVPALMGLMGQSRLGLDRDVPLLYSIRQYADYLQGVLVYTYLRADSGISVGAIAFVCTVLMFTRKGRRGLKALLLMLCAIALIPAAGSALNGFQYASNRWMWAAALCVAYVVAEMLPELSTATRLELRVFVVVALALGILLCLRPDSHTPLESPIVRAGVCGLVMTIGVVGFVSWARASDRAPSVALQQVIACVGVVLLTWIPFHYTLSRSYMKNRVEAGAAWGLYDGQPSLNAARSMNDDDVWRWDYAGINPLRNTAIMGQAPSFDAYANIYDQGVDTFKRDVELSSSQSFQTVSKLCSRSYLEAALGAKYFVIGAKPVGPDGESVLEEDTPEQSESDESATEEVATEESESDESATEEVATEESESDESATEESESDESATEESESDESATEEVATEESVAEESTTKKSLLYVPRNEELPYGVEPVDESEPLPYWTAFASKNELALPLAYTYARVITMDDYASLSAVQKQQALLQAVALEDAGEAAVADVDSASLAFEDVTIPYTMEGTKKARVKDGKIITTAKKQSVTLTLKDEAAGEVYVEFVGMTYENVRPELPEQPTQEELMRYLTRCYSWRHMEDYIITAESDSGRRQSLDNFTRYSHMYAADNNNIINLGRLPTCPKTITLYFSRAGVYSFDAINVIVQPTDSLERLVKERRMYPVDLSQGVNSFTASVENDEDQVFFLSIPWSRGWSATVDGVEAKVMKADGAFVALNLPAGNHEIQLRYTTPGLKLGLALSAAGIMALVVVKRVWNRFVP